MDVISDLLNQIRNAQAVSKETVEIPFSNFKYEIAKILEKEKFIEKVEKKGKKTKKSIEITLKYLPDAALAKGITRENLSYFFLEKNFKVGPKNLFSSQESQKS